MSDNLRDMKRKWRQGRGEGKKNHKLRLKEVKYILDNCNKGEQTKYAIAFGVDRSLISRIMNKKRWPDAWRQDGN